MAAERARWSVRTRVTAVGMLVVTVALTVAAVGFTAALDQTLTDSESSQAARYADDVASRVQAAGYLALPAGANRYGDTLVQLQRSGTVVARGAESLGIVFPAGRNPGRVDVAGVRYLVRSAPTTIAGVSYTVVVARSMAVVDRAHTLATGLLVAAVPTLSVLVGFLVWILTGRALRPVERVRVEVDSIGPAELDRRVTRTRTADEIDRLVDTMNRMLARLDRSERSQRAFVSDASHELRSPIATIRRHAELLRANPDPAETAEFARIVDAESARLEELVSSLLFLAHLDENRVPVVTDVDLDDLALAELDRLRALRPDAGSAGIGPARTTGDVAALSRAVRNVVDNALRHSRERVELSTTTLGDRAVLRVDDDGPGIPEDQREAVFGRFVRLDDARARDGGGSGLGLAIVAQVVRRSGGEVVVLDSPLGGARVELRLPVG